MKSKKQRTIPFRRKREMKTDYRKRLSLLTSPKPRLVIRGSIKHIVAQIVKYSEKGDIVEVSASSTELKKLGYNLNTGNIPAAYLTGIIIAKKALKKGIKEAIADIGMSTSVKGAKVYAVVKGAVEAGLKVPHSPEILPSNDAVSGKLIAAYLPKAKGNQFVHYNKINVKADSILKNIEDVKKKLMS